ncbi:MULTISPECIES: GNAT family N-acetyltransferase [Clostridium]|uniref:Acetyltransferase, GNAT family n=1 Tax=Clostridium butyricum E4 str. BoNT E BL5262 TaxID=632245 RepID=C4IH80_CLOBU|nr:MULTISPECIES: GNAT family N-acetyltransferase [Clostridium]APF24112.1 acetyltransferase domain protein [Clostridium butyricum]EDT75082.1 acetyltransferase, gnat family [Clostridium butyricum 5521]EEP53999.1 acetyltransferase, GNAT family [Clostridium butyricum E4 str. BoNT E BL5262]MDU2895415.1 GNAT family N-acetyltransferase [Clostridium sp.]MDU3007573.1 GNAT family N-acetyltransferase [Clostridium sp.]
MKIIEFNEQENSKNLNRILLNHLSERTDFKIRNESSISLAAFEEDNYIGGITAQKVFETCFVNLLAVEKRYQEFGVGRKLILELEYEAKRHGCKKIFLTTQDYQARKFYEKMGYKAVFELNDIPFIGTTRIFLIKNI